MLGPSWPSQKTSDLPKSLIFLRFFNVFDVAPLWPQHVISASSRALLGPSWGPLGLSSRHLGALLGPPGVILGPSCALLGLPWGPLGPSWGHPGSILASLDVSLGHLGGILRHLGRFVGQLGAILASFGALLNPFWDRLGAVLAPSSDQLRLCWGIFRAPSAASQRTLII